MLQPDWFSRLTPPLERAPASLEWMAWPDVQKTLGDVLLWPIGATEQHGPHLPVNTDTIIASSVCAYASARTGAPVMPPLNYTVSLGHTEKWPGTFSIFHETLMQTVREVTAWAHATGWKRLLLINSHFGNDAALRCAVDRLRFDHAGELFVATRNTWQLSPGIARQFTHDGADWHANEAETSLLLFLAPHAVREERIDASDDPDRTGNCVFPHMVAHTSMNGVTGAPTLGTKERGSALLREIGDSLCLLIERARQEIAPLTWRRQAAAFAS